MSDSDNSMNPLLAMLKRRLMTVWLWQALFVLSVICGFISTQVAIWQERQPIRFSTMDSRDSFYLSNLGTFEEAKQIHAEIAKMAAETIFSRSPDGPDFPERLERLFNPATTQQLQAEAARDSDVFRTQQIHQKFEAGTVREIALDNNTAVLSVEGQVLRQGMFNNRTVNDAKRVTVFLRVTSNSDMAHNGRYPMVVTRYETRWN